MPKVGSVEMFVCNKCGCLLDVDQYYIKKNGYYYRSCKLCLRARRIERYYDKQSAVDRAIRSLYKAKYRCKKRGHEFDLDADWITQKILAGHCEATGRPFHTQLTHGWKHHPYSPTIDRIDSNKGYTKENCWVVCWWFNAAKVDHPLETFDNYMIQRIIYKHKNNEDLGGLYAALKD